MLPDLANTIKRYASVEQEYPAFVKSVCDTCIQNYPPGSDDEQHFIDSALNYCQLLSLPDLNVIMNVVKHPVVIPEHLTEWGAGTEQKNGWNWAQVLYGIARATIEADIKRTLTERRKRVW